MLHTGGTMLQRTMPEAEPEAPMVLLDSALNTKQSRNWKKQFNTVVNLITSHFFGFIYVDTCL